MATVNAIKNRIRQLDNEALATFRDWFIEYAHARWEYQIAADSNAGKLDSIVAEALAEFRAASLTSKSAEERLK